MKDIQILKRCENCNKHLTLKKQKNVLIEVCGNCEDHPVIEIVKLALKKKAKKEVKDK